MPTLILDKVEQEIVDKVDWDKTMEKHEDKFYEFKRGEKGWSLMDLETMFVLEHLTDDEIVWNKNV
jgi:hypothetical protein